MICLYAALIKVVQEGTEYRCTFPNGAVILLPQKHFEENCRKVNNQLQDDSAYIYAEILFAYQNDDKSGYLANDRDGHRLSYTNDEFNNYCRAVPYLISVSQETDEPEELPAFASGLVPSPGTDAAMQEITGTQAGETELAGDSVAGGPSIQGDGIRTESDILD